MVLPLIGGLVGSALAGTGALGGIAAAASPLVAGAVGSGLGRFAETGSLEEGIKTGLTSFAGGKVIGSVMGSGQAGSAAIEGQEAQNMLAGKGAEIGGNAGEKLLDVSKAQYTPANTGTDLTGIKAVGRAGGDYLGSAEGIGSIIGQDLATPQYKPEEYEFEGDIDARPDDSGVRFGTAGGSREYDYGFDTNYAQGGSLAGYQNPTMMGFSAPVKQGGLGSIAEDDAMMDEFDDMDDVDGYFEGGELDEFDEMDDMDDMDDMDEFDDVEMPEMEDEPPNDKEIIMDAVDAIEDGEPDEEDQMALALFVQKFGEEALKDLVESVQRGEFEGIEDMNEGLIEGPGDAMDDLVPAENTSTGQDILLSGEEFIVPGDVVSGLGNGSTKAGSDELYEMMDRVREARTGTTEQPPKISAGGMLPA